MIATSSSDTKLEVARQLGATHLVNYRTHPSWEDEVLKATDGHGAHIVLEVVSGPNIEHTLRALRRGGLVAYVGMLSKEAKSPVNVMPDLWYGSKTSELTLLETSQYRHSLTSSYSPGNDRHRQQGDG